MHVSKQRRVVSIWHLLPKTNLWLMNIRKEFQRSRAVSNMVEESWVTSREVDQVYREDSFLLTRSIFQGVCHRIRVFLIIWKLRRGLSNQFFTIYNIWWFWKWSKVSLKVKIKGNSWARWMKGSNLCFQSSTRQVIQNLKMV